GQRPAADIDAVRGAGPVFPISEPLAPHGPHRRPRDSSRSRRWRLVGWRLRIGPCIGEDVLETAVVKRVLLEAIGSWLPSKADGAARGYRPVAAKADW